MNNGMMIPIPEWQWLPSWQIYYPVYVRQPIFVQIKIKVTTDATVLYEEEREEYWYQRSKGER